MLINTQSVKAFVFNGAISSVASSLMTIGLRGGTAEKTTAVALFTLLLLGVSILRAPVHLRAHLAGVSVTTGMLLGKVVVGCDMPMRYISFASFLVAGSNAVFFQ